MTSAEREQLEQEVRELNDALSERHTEINAVKRERDAYRATIADLLAATKDIDNPSQSVIYYRAQARDLLKTGPKRCACTHEAGDTHPCDAHPFCNECEQRTDRPYNACAEHTEAQQ